MEKHIYLNGFMGAGKSRIGPILASLLECPFYDTDKLIEQRAGKKISQIFNDDGEQLFRKLESDMIREVSAKEEKAVVSLGGGALTIPSNKISVEKKGIIIYLKSAPQVILQRIKHSSKRPLLNVPKDADFEKNMLKRITEMLEERKEIYESADIIISRDEGEPDQIARLIFQELKNYEKNRS